MEIQNEQTDNTELRLAAIFKHSNDNRSLDFESVVLIDYEKDKGQFKVCNGDFENSNEKAFNRITGEGDFIYGNSNQMEILDYNSSYSIYVFNDEFIKKVQEEKAIDLLNAYVYIAKKVSKIKIKTRDSVLHSNGNYISVKNPDSNNYGALDIIQMLYGNLEEEKVEVEFVEDEDFDKEVEQGEEESEEDSISVQGLIDELSSKYVGQESAVKTLVTSIYYNQVLIDSLIENENYDMAELDSRKISILLDGETGTGKTAILKEICQKLSIPMKIFPANSISETGYVGASITDVLADLFIQTEGDLELAERGIIVFDEIDKIASNASYGGRDMKKGVQEELLSFIGGGMYDVKIEALEAIVPFDTSYLTFILSGAFTGIKEKKEKELGKQAIGFSGTSNIKKNTYEVTAQDYIDFGISREFFGRIKVIANTKSYSVEDLKNILRSSAISPLRNFQKTAAIFGYENVSFTEEFIDVLAKEAYDMKTGARGLQTLMAEIQREYLLDFISGNFPKDKPIILEKEMLTTAKKQRVRTI